MIIFFIIAGTGDKDRTSRHLFRDATANIFFLNYFCKFSAKTADCFGPMDNKRTKFAIFANIIFNIQWVYCCFYNLQ